MMFLRSRVQVLKSNALVHQRTEAGPHRVTCSGAGGAKSRLVFVTGGLNCFHGEEHRLPGKILNGNVPDLHIPATVGSTDHAPRFSRGRGGSQPICWADDACRGFQRGDGNRLPAAGRAAFTYDLSSVAGTPNLPVGWRHIWKLRMRTLA